MEHDIDEETKTDKEEMDHTQIEYDIEDCFALTDQEDESIIVEKPVEIDLNNAMLEPDHPLLAKFQKALKEQLERQIHKISVEVHELEIGVRNKSVERDALGESVYDIQQLVMKQQQSIDQYDQEINNLISERKEFETDLEEIRSTNKENRNSLNQAERKEMELRSEIETINYMVRQMEEWENKLHSNLAVNQRISEKSKIDKRQFTDEKRNLDFIIYKLMTEVFRLENSLDHLNMQLRVKEKEREDIANSIARANADIESLEAEHKRLMQAWNCVLTSIAHRDKVYLATKKKLDEHFETLRSTIVEIEGTKRKCTEEMNKNEQLTLIKGRIDMDKTNLNARYTYETDRLNNLERKLMQTQIVLTQTIKDLEEVSGERKMKEQDLERINREIEKNAADKVEMEDKIVSLLQEQITNNKMSKYMNKTIRDHREKNRALEIQLASIENQNADILVDIERQKAENAESMRILENLIKSEKSEEDEVNAKKCELRSTTNEIKKMQIKFDTVNKKLEEILNNTEGVELTPQEQKINYLERQIGELTAKNQKLQTFWLRQQSYIVSLKEERSKQLYEMNIVQKQTMLLEQKNLKLEDELEDLDRQKKVTNRNMVRIKTKIDRLNDALMKKKGQRTALDSNNICFRNDIIFRLKDAEMECIQMETQLSDLEDEKTTLTRELLDINRDTLAWECKMKLAVETKQTIAKEKSSEGEIGNMRAEIHRMTVRYSQLRKAQEKLIQDLNHCLTRREIIFVNSEATEKRLAGTGKAKNRMNFKRKLEDLQTKVKKTENEVKSVAKKMSQLHELEPTMQEEIAERECFIHNMETKIIELTTDIATEKQDRQKELELLIFKQHKLNAYSSIIKNQYKSVFRTASTLDIQNSKELDLNTKLQTVVENLILDFPQHYPIFAKILNTLKLTTLD